MQTFIFFLKTIKNDFKNYGGISVLKCIILILFNKNFKFLFSIRLIYLLNKSWFIFRIFNIWFKYRQQVEHGCYVHCEAEIGQNIKFPHAFSIIIGAAKIEDNVTIFQNVTIGSHGNEDKIMAWPTIKDGAVLFSGSKIIGDIQVGKQSVVGANAVINKNVPDYAIIISTPPKIVGYK
jgi:serine O-acetyltransferase